MIAKETPSALAPKQRNTPVNIPQQFDINYVVAELCGGGLMLGAFFMATDYVTSPITPMGKIIFGICCAPKRNMKTANVIM